MLNKQLVFIISEGFNLLHKNDEKNRKKGYKYDENIYELMEGSGDIAVGAMTINFARESVIDFTKAGNQQQPLNQSIHHYALIGCE